MAKAKAKSSKVSSKPAPQNDVAEARPVGQGKDPLAEGNTLVNPTNSDAETHYDVKEKSEDVSAREAQNKLDGQDANQRAEQHNSEAAAPVTSGDAADQEDVAAGREEESTPADEPENSDKAGDEDAPNPPADEL